MPAINDANNNEATTPHMKLNNMLEDKTEISSHWRFFSFNKETMLLKLVLINLEWFNKKFEGFFKKETPFLINHAK